MIYHYNFCQIPYKNFCYNKQKDLINFKQLIRKDIIILTCIYHINKKLMGIKYEQDMS